MEKFDKTKHIRATDAKKELMEIRFKFKPEHRILVRLANAPEFHAEIYEWHTKKTILTAKKMFSPEWQTDFGHFGAVADCFDLADLNKLIEEYTKRNNERTEK